MAFGSRLTTAHCMLAAFLLLELVPLLVPKPFYVDWVNHVWLLEYYTQYLRDHWTFPPTINVEQGFGNPMPLFYGIFFYPLLAFLSLITGADIALRLCFAVLLVAPVGTIYILFKSLLKNPVLAVYLSISVNFSMYQLTNLYFRAALTEFFAFQIIILGFSLIYYGLLYNLKISNALLGLGFASFTLAMGAHPITLYLFCIFTCPIIVIHIYNQQALFGNYLHSKVILFIGGSGTVLVPWLLNTVLLHSKLKISNSKLYYFPQSIDSFWAKIGFLYVDQRVIEQGPFNTDTPFLDAPLPLGLAVIISLVCYHLYHSKKVNLFKHLLPAGLVVLFLVIVIIPPHAGFVGAWPNSIYVTREHGFLYHLLLPIQFAYRLTGTLSLCLVAMIIFSVHLMCRHLKDKRYNKKLTVVVMVASFLAVLGNIQKVSELYLEYILAPQFFAASSQEISEGHIQARTLLIKPEEYQLISTNTNRYPFTFYGSRAYTMPQLYQPRPETDDRDLQTIPAIVRDYANEMVFTCDRPCLLQTNIVPTTLHRVLIDGREPDKVFLAKTENLDFELPAGEHVLRVDLVGDYVRPIIISIWVALGLLCLVVIHATVVIAGEVRAGRNLLAE